MLSRINELKPRVTKTQSVSIWCFFGGLKKSIFMFFYFWRLSLQVTYTNKLSTKKKLYMYTLTTSTTPRFCKDWTQFTLLKSLALPANLFFHPKKWILPLLVVKFFLRMMKVHLMMYMIQSLKNVKKRIQTKCLISLKTRRMNTTLSLGKSNGT